MRGGDSWRFRARRCLSGPCRGDGASYSLSYGCHHLQSQGKLRGLLGRWKTAELACTQPASSLHHRHGSRPAGCFDATSQAIQRAQQGLVGAMRRDCAHHISVGLALGWLTSPLQPSWLSVLKRGRSGTMQRHWRVEAYKKAGYATQRSYSIRTRVPRARVSNPSPKCHTGHSFEADEFARSPLLCRRNSLQSWRLVLYVLRSAQFPQPSSESSGRDSERETSSIQSISNLGIRLLC